MNTALTIQILVYMGILALIAFAWGYHLGHRDGLIMGRTSTHKLYKRLFENADK